nr:hypothetical protein Q903MT_gene6306 [Picea sitchensis]
MDLRSGFTSSLGSGESAVNLNRFSNHSAPGEGAFTIDLARTNREIAESLIPLFAPHSFAIIIRQATRITSFEPFRITSKERVIIRLLFGWDIKDGVIQNV